MLAFHVFICKWFLKWIVWMVWYYLCSILVAWLICDRKSSFQVYRKDKYVEIQFAYVALISEKWYIWWCIMCVVYPWVCRLEWQLRYTIQTLFRWVCSEFRDDILYIYICSSADCLSFCKRISKSKIKMVKRMVTVEDKWMDGMIYSSAIHLQTNILHGRINVAFSMNIEHIE